MSCDPATLLDSAKCILACLSQGQMDAASTRLFCGMATTATGFVLKAGDTMTGTLLTQDTFSFRSGLDASADVAAFSGFPFASLFGSSTGFNEILCRYSNDSSGASMLIFKTRSAVDTSADVIVQNADTILALSVGGANGVGYNQAAQITYTIDAVPGLNDMPGRINLRTTPDGSSSVSTRWFVSSAGLLSGTASLTIKSSTAIPAGGASGVGYVFSSTANFGAFFGSNVPTLSAAQGSWYLRSDGTTTNDRAFINTDGAGTWTAITTVA